MTLVVLVLDHLAPAWPLRSMRAKGYGAKVKKARKQARASRRRNGR